MKRHFHMVRATLLAVLVAGAAGIDARQDLATTTAPDLRLEWIGDRPAQPPPAAGESTKPTIEMSPIDGRAGETIRLKYRIRNVGASDAFAVLIKVQSGLGVRARTTRISPGPTAGKALERTLDLPLAVGLVEVCISAVLQTVRSDDPRDPFTEDNRICRRAHVRPAERGTGNPKSR